jgi:hypothetical protein
MRTGNQQSEIRGGWETYYAGPKGAVICDKAILLSFLRFQVIECITNFLCEALGKLFLDRIIGTTMLDIRL